MTWIKETPVYQQSLEAVNEDGDRVSGILRVYPYEWIPGDYVSDWELENLKGMLFIAYVEDDFQHAEIGHFKTIEDALTTAQERLKRRPSGEQLRFARIATLSERLRWMPLFHTFKDADPDLLMEVVILIAATWERLKPEYAVEYIRWMTNIFGNALLEKAQERMRNPLPQNKWTWETSDPEFPIHNRTACEHIQDCYEGIFKAEMML